MHAYGMRRQNIIRRKKTAHFGLFFALTRKDFILQKYFEINSI